jgi:hypothetical protein
MDFEALTTTSATSWGVLRLANLPGNVRFLDRGDENVKRIARL